MGSADLVVKAPAGRQLAGALESRRIVPLEALAAEGLGGRRAILGRRASALEVHVHILVMCVTVMCYTRLTCTRA